MQFGGPKLLNLNAQNQIKTDKMKSSKSSHFKSWNDEIHFLYEKGQMIIKIQQLPIYFLTIDLIDSAFVHFHTFLCGKMVISNISSN